MYINLQMLIIINIINNCIDKMLDNKALWDVNIRCLQRKVKKFMVDNRKKMWRYINENMEKEVTVCFAGIYAL